MKKQGMIKVSIAAALLLLICAAFYLYENFTWSSNDGEDLFKTLDVNQVESFTVSAYGASVAVVRKNGLWRIKSNNYPASFPKVKKLLGDLSSFRALRNIGTPDKEDKDAFFLNNLSSDGKRPSGVTLELFGAGNQKIVSMVAGRMIMSPESGQRPDGRYFRVTSGKRDIYCISSDAFEDLIPVAGAWMDALPGFGGISSLSVSNPKDKWSVLKTDKGHVLSYGGKTSEPDKDSLTLLLSYLMAPIVLDALPPGKKLPSGQISRIEIKSKDGFSYIYTLVKADKKYYMKIETSYLPAKDGKAKAEQSPDALQAKFENDKLKALWVFEISERSYDLLTTAPLAQQTPKQK